MPVKKIAQPWTARSHLTAALQNRDVRIGERDGLRGVYALKDFAPGDLVASFHGRIVTRPKLFELRNTDPELFDRVNEYAVWHTQLKGHLYPEDIDKLGAHLINHSCGPNAQWGPTEHGAVLVLATKHIAAGDEITIHYGWVGLKAAMENKRHACWCRASFCTGTIELFVEFIRDGDTGGPYLPTDEIQRRLLADIVNNTNEHEAVVIRYATSAADMVLGGTEAIPPDPAAMFDKVRRGAIGAIPAARKLQQAGTAISEARLVKIAHTYNLPIPERNT